MLLLMEPQHTIQQGLQKLNRTFYHLINELLSVDAYIKDYVSTYVECHLKSDEFFMTLCEHKFLQTMLSLQNRVQTPTCLLENLNLLLANTKDSSQLVYFLSQNCLHDYLFGPNVLSSCNEFIEYYIQLLKTILMKIVENEENKSFIKFFCNSKYPTFPILTYSSILAGDENQLVKVTAQQCILVLVRIINEKQLYSSYLTELPMLAFYARLGSDYLNPDADHEGITKYLVDLNCQLRENTTALIILNNIICNCIVIQSLPNNYIVALQFVWNFSSNIKARLREQKGVNFNNEVISKEAADNLLIICATHYRVLIKFMTNKYISSNSMSTIVTLSLHYQTRSSQLKFPSPVAQWKLFRENCAKTYMDDQPKSLQYFEYDLFLIVENKVQEYESSKQFNKLRENYLRKATGNKGNEGFFGNFFKKISNADWSTIWFKWLLQVGSIKIDKLRTISSMFPRNINPLTCSFICEYAHLVNKINRKDSIKNMQFGQEVERGESNEIHFNDFRSAWSFSSGSIPIIEKMVSQLLLFLDDKDPEFNLVLPQLYVPPQYFFIVQLKQYLEFSIHEHLNKDPKNKQLTNDLTTLTKFGNICSKLNVKINEQAFTSLALQLHNIHQTIQAWLFEKGFDDLVEYIGIKNRLICEDKNKSEKNEKSPKKSVLLQKMNMFETIQKIMGPNLKTLKNYFDQVWRQEGQPLKGDELLISSFNTTYYGTPNCRLMFIKSKFPPTIFMVISVNGKAMSKFDLFEVEQIKINKINNKMVQIMGNTEVVCMNSSEKAEEVLKTFKECKFMISDAVTNTFVQYLEATHIALTRNSKILSKSALMETPQ